MTYSLTPGDRFNASLTGVYTGKMELVHFAGAPEQAVDEYVTTPAFFEWGVKVGYTFKFECGRQLDWSFSEVKNLTNAYQNDFDTGRNRDSGYIYGPVHPEPFIWD